MWGLWLTSVWADELDWRTRITPFGEPDQPDIIWYFIHDGASSGAGYFVGYQGSTNRPFGYIGESGFRSVRPPRLDQIPVRSGMMATVRFWSPERRAWPRDAFGNSPGALAECAGQGVCPIRESPSLGRSSRAKLCARLLSSPEPISSLDYFFDQSLDFLNQTPRREDNSPRAATLRRPARLAVLEREHQIIRTYLPSLANPERPHLLDANRPPPPSGPRRDLSTVGAPRPTRILSPRESLYQVAPDGTTPRPNRDRFSKRNVDLGGNSRNRVLEFCIPVPLIFPLVDLSSVFSINQPGSSARQCGPCWKAPGRHCWP